jgi:hypothetical protein
MTQFQIPSNVPSKLKGQVFDARKLLPVNPKYSWESLKGLRDINDLSTIVCHHDALTKASSKPYSDIEFAKRIAQSHIRSEKNLKDGDAGFPYHIWIRSGVIYICNDLEAFTFGVASNNGYTVHICVSGNYAGIDVLEDRDRNALYAAILMVRSLVPTIKAIKGHREITATSCPGYDMDKVRTDVANIEATMALSGELDEAPNNTIASIYAAYARFTDLYNVANKPGPNQPEAQRKCLLIADMMVQSGILQKLQRSLLP